MNAGDRRRLHERAGILMITKGMDLTRAIIEAAKQLGLVDGATDQPPLPGRRQPADSEESS